MAATATGHDGDSVAAADARWRQAVDGLPLANKTRESSTGPRERWTRARCGCLPGSSILPVSPENQPPSNDSLTPGTASVGEDPP